MSEILHKRERLGQKGIWLTCVSSNQLPLLTSLARAPTHFGAYTSLLTQPRVMQFALRYEF